MDAPTVGIGKPHVGLVGIGSCLPLTVLTNKDLEKIVDTTDEWIQDRTGIKERRISTKQESLPILMSIAALRAIQNAGLSPNDIDYIYAANNNTDPFSIPHIAPRVQYIIEAKKSSAQDVIAGCSGALYAIENAYRTIRDIATHEKRNVTALVLAGDTLFNILDINDRRSSVILADGAGAAVLQVIDHQDNFPNLGINHIITGSDGSEGYNIYCRTGRNTPLVSANPLTLENSGQMPGPFIMDGKAVHKFISRTTVNMIAELLERAKLPQSSLAEMIMIPHQANQRSMEDSEARIKEHFGFKPKIYKEDVVRYANTSAGSVLIATDSLYRSQQLNFYDKILFTVLGAGLSHAAALMHWNKELPKEQIIYDKLLQATMTATLNERYNSWLAKLPK